MRLKRYNKAVLTLTSREYFSLTNAVNEEHSNWSIIRGTDTYSVFQNDVLAALLNWGEYCSLKNAINDLGVASCSDGMCCIVNCLIVVAFASVCRSA